MSDVEWSGVECQWLEGSYRSFHSRLSPVVTQGLNDEWWKGDGSEILFSAGSRVHTEELVSKARGYICI